MNKQDKNKAIDNIIKRAKRQGSKIPLLPGSGSKLIDSTKKGKLYSAEEAMAEKKQRDEKQSKTEIVLAENFIKKPTESDYFTKMLLKYAKPLEHIQNDMVLQAMRYIIGPTLDFPIDKIYRLFNWADVKRHPKTGEHVGSVEYKVFYFWGDVGEELLKNKTQHVPLIWHEYDLPSLKKNDKGDVIGLNNNWTLLFDDDSEYGGDEDEKDK